MAVSLPYVSSIAQAKEYASAAMSASASVCPSAYDRYKEAYASAATYEQQKIAGTPFEGDAVRRLVDMLDSANGFCHDVKVTGSSSPPARTVTGSEPDPMPTYPPVGPSGSYIPPSPGGGTTYKPASVAAGVTAGALAGLPWWAWGGLAVLGVWFWKKSKKKKGGTKAPRRRVLRRRATRRNPYDPMTGARITRAGMNRMSKLQLWKLLTLRERRLLLDLNGTIRRTPKSQIISWIVRR